MCERDGGEEERGRVRKGGARWWGVGGGEGGSAEPDMVGIVEL